MKGGGIAVDRVASAVHHLAAEVVAVVVSPAADSERTGIASVAGGISPGSARFLYLPLIVQAGSSRGDAEGGGPAAHDIDRRRVFADRQDIEFCRAAVDDMPGFVLHPAAEGIAVVPRLDLRDVEGIRVPVLACGRHPRVLVRPLHLPAVLQSPARGSDMEGRRCSDPLVLVRGIQADAQDIHDRGFGINSLTVGILDAAAITVAVVPGGDVRNLQSGCVMALGRGFVPLLLVGPAVLPAVGEVPACRGDFKYRGLPLLDEPGLRMCLDHKLLPGLCLLLRPHEVFWIRLHNG